MYEPVHRYIKAVGSGAKRARDLTRGEARDAMTLVTGGTVQPVQVGAFLLALRMKGESAAELAGFTDALMAGTATADAPPGTLDVDCHGDGHEGRPTRLPAAALALARLGVPVLLRADLDNPKAKHGLREALAALGIAPSRTTAEAAQALASRRVALLDLPDYCPALHRLVSLRPLLGVRTVAQTLMKTLTPLRVSARAIGVFHAPYLPSAAQAMAELGEKETLCVQALGGLPEASPGKIVRVARASAPEPVSLDLRFLEGDSEEDRTVAAGTLLLHAARGEALPDAANAVRNAIAQAREER
jgi:anthranilate phosphoribosyltransferase